MKILFILFSMLFSVSSHAKQAPLNSVRLYLFNPEMRFERDSSQEIIDRKPLNFSMAYKRKDFSIDMEYVRFREVTGNATAAIDRIHQDFLLWLKYHFLQYGDNEVTFNLLAGAGAGAYEETVTTSLMNANRTDSNGFKFLSGMVLGAEVVRTINQYLGILFAVEGRSLFAAENDPNPLPSGVLRFGIQYQY